MFLEKTLIYEVFCNAFLHQEHKYQDLFWKDIIKGIVIRCSFTHYYTTHAFELEILQVLNNTAFHSN